MAEFWWQIPAGGRPQDISTGSGAPTIGADTVSIVFDRTNQTTRNDVLMGIEQIRIAILEGKYPPV